MTTAELLDALEDRVASVRTRLTESGQRNTSLGPYTTFAVEDSASADTVHWTFSVSKTSAVTPDKLRVQMDLAGLTKAGFATVFDVPVSSVQDWLAGVRPIPSWVLPSVRLYALLDPADRQRVLRTPASSPRVGRRQVHAHPFARIEEL